MRSGPLATPEFKRIIGLPQRNPEEEGEFLVDAVTETLKKPEGTMELWPIQALALYEAAAYDGAFCLLPVGKGKTLVSFLLPTVMESKRAVLLVPGALRAKTFEDFFELSKHWEKHPHYFIYTYEYVSTHPDCLKELRPDLIVADEAHKLKNQKAGCTKRVVRYWKESETTRFVPLSGTLTTRSFFDFWHLQIMALPVNHAILPYDYRVAEQWSQAMDVNDENRIPLGALTHFGDGIDKARKGYGDFIKNVPGVIAADSSEIGTSIQIDFFKIESPKVDASLRALSKKWELPNGDTVCTGPEFYRHARELALGFYYVWKYQPPDEWRIARTEYGRFVRQKLKYSRKFETPSQIDEAFSDRTEITRWKQIEKSFTPETEPIWFDQTVISGIVRESLKLPCLVWYKHKAVGKALADYMPVYVAKGETSNGSHIYRSKHRTVAVSINAMSEGFNLQQWSKNMVITPPGNGRDCEQLIGRTHRSGQKADEVEVRILETSTSLDDFNRALKDAEYIQATTAQKQKLCIADKI